jgi:hypothetical protein
LYAKEITGAKTVHPSSRRLGAIQLVPGIAHVV